VTLPSLVNDISLRHRFAPDILGGELRLELDTTGFYRRSNVDVTGRDVLRIGAVADWQRQWISGSGLVFSTTAQMHADVYNIYQDTSFASQIARAIPVAATELRWPLMKSGPRATQVIEPVLQLVWSPDTVTAVPDDTSQMVEFEANNLFSLNRFAGVDTYEGGLRANLGVNYSRRGQNGWALDARLGRVFRAADLGQFTAASGLSGTASSYVGAFQLALPSKLRLTQRSVFDTGFNLSKNETALAFQNKKFDIETSYLWLVSGAASNTSDRSEWSVNTGLDLAGNWRTESEFRYDLISRKASDAAVALTYRNECIKLDLSLSRSFVSSSNITASTNLGLQVTLEGFGSRADSGSYKRKCSDL